MTIRCETLEPRTPAVALQWVFEPDSWLLAREPVIRAAGDALAARLTRPDTDVYRIDVQTGPQPGALADAYAVSPNAGVIRFDTGRPWDQTFSLPAVAMHELSHAVGVGEHNPTPGTLLYPFAPFVGTDPDVSHTDVALFERAGWAVKPRTAFPDRDYVRVFPEHLTGWAYMTLDDAGQVYPDYVRRDDPGGDSWAMFPPN